MVVIKELSQSFWTPSKLPCRSAASLNAPICCQASAAVHLVNRVGPRQAAKATVAGCRVLSAGSIQCQPPAPGGDPWWSFARSALTFLLTIYRGPPAAGTKASQEHMRDILDLVSSQEQSPGQYLFEMRTMPECITVLFLLPL